MTNDLQATGSRDILRLRRHPLPPPQRQHDMSLASHPMLGRAAGLQGFEIKIVSARCREHRPSEDKLSNNRALTIDCILSYGQGEVSKIRAGFRRTGKEEAGNVDGGRGSAMFESNKKSLSREPRDSHYGTFVRAARGSTAAYSGSHCMNRIPLPR